MKPGPDADRVLLAHMRDCLDRIREYTNAERSRFDASRLVQDAGLSLYWLLFFAALSGWRVPLGRDVGGVVGLRHGAAFSPPA